MSDFEKYLSELTAQGSNGVHGCIVNAFDKTGKTLLFKAAGHKGLDADAPPVSSDDTFWIASCTKLVTTIAVMQCVEKGQITLDEPVEHLIPEVKSFGVLSGKDADGKVTTTPIKNTITLRLLLTHTSGMAYDEFVPELQEWRAQRGEPLKTLSGSVTEGYNCPLIFEPGSAWSYSPSIDWAGCAVARLNKTTPGNLMGENIFTPLGMDSTTFHLEEKPDVRKRLVPTGERQADGSLKMVDCPFSSAAPEDAGGAGLWSSVPDFSKILAELISDSPKILKKETIDQMYQEQLQGPPLDALKSSMEFLGRGFTPTAKVNWGLGGMLVQESYNQQPRMQWGGYPNLGWVADRHKGVACLYASQVIPPDDKESGDAIDAFYNEVWRVAGITEEAPEAVVAPV